MGAHTGTVKFFSDEKVYGFIAPKDGSKDVFVHKSNVMGQIREGNQVSYDVERGDKGLSAIGVVLD